MQAPFLRGKGPQTVADEREHLPWPRPQQRRRRNPSDTMTDQKPYRPNVGIALFNLHGHVLIARRFKDDGPEIVLPGLEWQMPQGGIDAREDPRRAAARELYEETGVRSA